MAAPKRTKHERERDLEIISELYLRGWTQRRIAARIGVSHTQINRDLKTIQKRWMDSSVRNFDDARAEELARIDELERTYWKEWERSREDKVTVKTRKQAKDAPKSDGWSKDENDEKSTIRTADHTEIVEHRLGDPRYLEGVRWCIGERVKLLGLAAPIQTKMELTGRDGGPVQTEDLGEGKSLRLVYYDMPTDQRQRVNDILEEARQLGGAASVDNDNDTRRTEGE